MNPAVRPGRGFGHPAECWYNGRGGPDVKVPVVPPVSEVMS